MKFQLFTLGLTSLLLSNVTFGTVCPTNKNAPLCPTSGSTLLDETYPTQAFVISNAPFAQSQQSAKVASDYISTIAKSYDFQNMPQVLVPVSTTEDFNKIVEKVKQNLVNNKVKAEDITIILNQITHVPARNYTWQQDYFESFVDLKTGTPVIREFESYTQNRKETAGVVAKLENAGKECQIAQGENLTSHHKKGTAKDDDSSFMSGEMGGNVEGAPGGFCLIGDNQSKKLAASYCGKEENIIQLQTSWLTVGHVDEIFKILPSQFNDGRPKECNFSLMAASPKKALELMQTGSNKTNPFYAFSNHLTEDELKEVKQGRSSLDYNRGGAGNKIICDSIENAIKSGTYNPNPRQNKEETKTKSVFLNLIINNAIAGASRTRNSESQALSFKCEDYIDQAPNEVIGAGIKKDQNLINLNTAIQDSIDKDKELIKTQILSRLPQCTKYFDTLDVPDLFYGATPIEQNGKFVLPKDREFGGAINSFLPNPTNSVLMNRTVLLPESGNPTFDNYVSSELKKRKLETVKIDSWDYAHVGQGNIHCSSHSIPYCQPR